MTPAPRQDGGGREPKPLGIKAYGHIPHLPGSRMGPSDHHCHEGQARICTEKARDKHDKIIVQEKLDGSCVAVALKDGQLYALGRAGWLAQSSPYKQHQLFAYWVRENEARFRDVLQEGERLVGEWLAQAHGTRYNLHHEPFVAFDLIKTERLPVGDFMDRLMGKFVFPRIINNGEPYSIEKALEAIEISGHGATDPVEGVVWRVERKGKVDFLCKYVRPDKVDGCYLPERNGGQEIWNWKP
jgi:ATP-dependent RNA circularization protein (DNA/RNA ligase family)